MTTMSKIKAMTGKELVDFLTDGAYEGCGDGLFFITEIEGREIRYTLEMDNKGIIQRSLELGYLKDEEIEDLDELSRDEALMLAEIYWQYEEEIDKSFIETMRDEIIEDLEKELEEIKERED